MHPADGEKFIDLLYKGIRLLCNAKPYVLQRNEAASIFDEKEGCWSSINGC